MRNMTLIERLGWQKDSLDDVEVTVHMDEEAFHLFYERTARQLWGYLARLSGSGQAADDLLQETYYRLLRCNRTFESDEHRRNYLFRIATNLVRDMRRRPAMARLDDADGVPAESLVTPGDTAEAAANRTDLDRALARLKPRERSLLWLAYANGSSHEEIAQALGVRRSSVKALLFRARRRLAGLLTAGAPAMPKVPRGSTVGRSRMREMNDQEVLR